MKWKVAVLRCENLTAHSHIDDTGTQVLREMIEEDMDGELLEVRTVPLESIEVSAALYELVDYHRVDLIFTLGGIGLAADDIVPEATLKVLDRQVPGIAEKIRAVVSTRNATAILQRGVAGLKNQTLIINFPHQPNAILESIQILLPILRSALQTLRGQ